MKQLKANSSSLAGKHEFGAGRGDGKMVLGCPKHPAAQMAPVQPQNLQKKGVGRNGAAPEPSMNTWSIHGDIPGMPWWGEESRDGALLGVSGLWTPPRPVETPNWSQSPLTK